MIQIIDIDSLVPFENHPFKERSGIEQLAGDDQPAFSL